LETRTRNSFPAVTGAIATSMNRRGDLYWKIVKE